MKPRASAVLSTDWVRVGRQHALAGGPHDSGVGRRGYSPARRLRTKRPRIRSIKSILGALPNASSIIGPAMPSAEGPAMERIMRACKHSTSVVAPPAARRRGISSAYALADVGALARLGLALASTARRFVPALLAAALLWPVQPALAVFTQNG